MLLAKKYLFPIYAYMVLFAQRSKNFKRYLPSSDCTRLGQTIDRTRHVLVVMSNLRAIHSRETRPNTNQLLCTGSHSIAVLSVSHSAMYSFHEKNIQLLTRLVKINQKLVQLSKSDEVIQVVNLAQKYPSTQYSNKKSKTYLTKFFSSHHYPQLFYIQ